MCYTLIFFTAELINSSTSIVAEVELVVVIVVATAVYSCEKLTA
jgi:hypothetical protein